MPGLPYARQGLTPESMRDNRPDEFIEIGAAMRSADVEYGSPQI